MRSASYYSKSKSSLRTNNGNKVKSPTTDKTHQLYNHKPGTPNSPTNIQRPGSCPVDDSWAPSRNWHNYLSGKQPPTSPKPKPQSLSPQLKATIPLPGVTSPRAVGCSDTKPTLLRLSKPPDDLFSVKLPEVNFCSGEVPESPAKRTPSFNDLCDDDKRRIAVLVEELARCKQEKQEDEVKILELKNKISELKASLKKISSVKSSDMQSISVLKSLQANEQIALKKQLTELNELLVKMQVQKATSEVHVKTITEKAEKMTRALHAMHRENTELQVEIKVAKEQLRLANQTVDKMTKDLKKLQDHIKPPSEDKSCQSSKDIASERVHVKTLNVEEKESEDQQILTELFFNKSLLKNTYNPQETIIFLSSDYKSSLPNNSI